MPEPTAHNPTTGPTPPPVPRDGANGDLPRPKPRIVICPYCGCRTEEAAACSQCHGRFDPLSRQATQNAMGPWFVRDERRPNSPGCSFASLLKLIKAGSVGPETVIRGPTTRQFWMLAKHTPGVANRLGSCHNCGKDATAEDFSCGGCGAVFTVEADRQFLGLGPVRDLSQTPPTDPIGSPPRPVPSRPTIEPLKSGAPPGAPPSPRKPTPESVPSRPFSRRRLAVNLMVGAAVFVLVLGLVLSTLNVLPTDLFRNGGNEPSDAGESIASATTPAEPAPVLQPELLDFGGPPSIADAGEPEANTEGEAPGEAAKAEGVSERSVSSEQRIFERAVEVLRLGDAVAIRESIQSLDHLMGGPRVPEWAGPIRDRLRVRLERLQFARLP